MDFECLVTHIPPLPAAVQNTSGAGDCLVAGFCAALLKHQTADHALAHGVVRKFIHISLAHLILFHRIEYRVQGSLDKSVQQLWAGWTGLAIDRDLLLVINLGGSRMLACAQAQSDRQGARISAHWKVLFGVS